MINNKLPIWTPKKTALVFFSVFCASISLCFLNTDQSLVGLLFGRILSTFTRSGSTDTKRAVTKTSLRPGDIFRNRFLRSTFSGSSNGISNIISGHGTTRKRYTPSKILDNGAVPSTTASATLEAMSESLKGSNSFENSEALLSKSFMHQNFSSECWYYDCGKNHSLLSTLLFESIGGKILKADAPIEEYIYNPHSESFWNMLDVGFVFDSTFKTEQNMRDVFNLWRHEVEGFHIIILVEKDELLDKIPLPSWMTDYEIYSIPMLLQLTNEIEMPKFNMRWDRTAYESPFSIAPFNQSLGLRNWVNWIADRENLFIIDRYSGVPFPVASVAATTTATSTETDTAVGTSHTTTSSVGTAGIIRQHIANLRTPSIQGYFSTVTDPYKPGSDFPRGFPYHLRDGVQTVISQGSFIGENDYDALTRLLKTPEKSEEVNAYTRSIPQKNLFSISITNLAINRALVGPALMYYSPEVTDSWDAQKKGFLKYADIISGWCLKLAMDQMNFGGKLGAPFSIKQTDLMVSPKSSEALARDIADDPMLNYTIAAEVYDVFERFFMVDSRWKNPECENIRYARLECIYTEMAKWIRKHLAEKYPFFDDYTHSMMVWFRIWTKRHAWDAKLSPVAYKSSMGPSKFGKKEVSRTKVSSIEKNKPGKCAMITITHNDKEMLPRWINYYSKHFEKEDMWILDHMTTDGSTDPDKIPEGINYLPMEGNKYNMPVQFRSTVIQLYQDRFFRAGYKCVLFTDTDEIVAPNPEKYPGGLKEYLDKFIVNEDMQFSRVVAFEVAHISYGNGTVESQEPPFDWSKSVLSQRKYAYRDGRYDKPLLTKMRLFYKPGFHKLTDIEEDRKAPQDPDLVMFHLRSLDLTYCMEMEERKYSMAQRMQRSELYSGFANHWNRKQDKGQHADICKFAIGCFSGDGNPAITRYDNTGIVGLIRLEDYWSKVEF